MYRHFLSYGSQVVHIRIGLGGVVVYCACSEVSSELRVYFRLYLVFHYRFFFRRSSGLYAVSRFGLYFYLFEELRRLYTNAYLSHEVVGLFSLRYVMYAARRFRGSLSAKVCCTHLFWCQGRLQYLFGGFLHVISRF